jgi:hypothetical protein
MPLHMLCSLNFVQADHSYQLQRHNVLSRVFADMPQVDLYRKSTIFDAFGETHDLIDT